MKKSKGKKVGLALLVIFLIMQFFRIDKSAPQVDPKLDFLEMTNPSDEVKALIKDACYDCHSYETVYPWYSNIAPVSWWTKHHVDEGREELNFSVWAEYSLKKADHKLEECAEEVEEGEMPLSSYTVTHSEAKLSKEQKESLEEFFNSKRDFSSDEKEEEHDD